MWRRLVIGLLIMPFPGRGDSHSGWLSSLEAGHLQLLHVLLGAMDCIREYADIGLAAEDQERLASVVALGTEQTVRSLELFLDSVGLTAEKLSEIGAVGGEV